MGPPAGSRPYLVPEMADLRGRAQPEIQVGPCRHAPLRRGDWGLGGSSQAA